MLESWTAFTRWARLWRLWRMVAHLEPEQRADFPHAVTLPDGTTKAAAELNGDDARQLLQAMHRSGQGVIDAWYLRSAYEGEFSE